jgi:hypothetical protein
MAFPGKTGSDVCLGRVGGRPHNLVERPQINNCYRLFCRVVLTLTSVSDREIRVYGADHRQDFYYRIIAPVNLPGNPLDPPLGSYHNSESTFFALIIIYISSRSKGVGVVSSYSTTVYPTSSTTYIHVDQYPVKVTGDGDVVNFIAACDY